MIFYLNDEVNTETLKDSMQLDSHTLIANLNHKDIKAYIEVVGEVAVWWRENEDSDNGELYTIPSYFPKNLKELIKNDDEWFNDPRLYINMNNWFELFVERKGENVPLHSECINVEGLTPREIFELLYHAIADEIEEGN